MDDVIMQSKVWKDLPCDLHAHILQFCSMPQLCRLRSVCREWNNLIHKLGFALKYQPQHTYIFKAPRFYSISAITYRDTKDALWQIRKEEDCNDEIMDLLRNSSDLFDTINQKSYPIGMEFMYDDVRSRYDLLDRFQIMAADKGFVWVLWSRYAEVMQVANLVTRSVIEIPPIRTENTFCEYVTGAMTIADDHASFTLYVVSTRVGYTPCFARFDSHVGKWQEFSRPPGIFHPSNEVQLLNKTLYTRFWDHMKYRYTHMFALDTMRDSWIDMGLGRRYNANVSEIVATLGRLFYVQLFDHNHEYNDYEGSVYKIDPINDDVSIKIEEIDIASGKWLTIATMNKASHRDLLKSLSCSLASPPSGGANTAVVGCGDFIVITSVTGKCIAYDVVNNELKEWSFGKSIVDPRNVGDKVRYGMFAMSMTLTLNPVPPPQD